jgi:hypothetical protein
LGFGSRFYVKTLPIKILCGDFFFLFLSSLHALSN